MIIIKTPEQIEGIRFSCQLAAKTLRHIEQFVQPGVSTAKIDQEAETFMRDHGAIPACLGYANPIHNKIPFPKSICTSINEVICHGIPSDTDILKEGDIITVDVTTILNGYYGDTATTYPIGKISKKAADLMECTKECLDIGIKEVKPGNHIGDIGQAIQYYANACGYSVIEIFCGHGTGIFFHEEPQITHTGRHGEGPEIAQGMIFTIEPMICCGNKNVLIDSKDNWTARTYDGKLSAQYEHTILATSEGHEILTI